MAPIVAILAGVLLLLAGRRLFWISVAILGFLVAVEVARELFAGQPAWMAWVLGAAVGIVGALLAVFLQRVAIGLAGAYAGAFLALVVAQSLGWAAPGLAVLFVGGVIGAVAAVLLTDWAIIVLSALAGAGMIVGALALAPLQSALLAGVLAAAGAIVQAKTFRGKPGSPSRVPGN